jgi:hypothetical protein
MSNTEEINMGVPTTPDQKKDDDTEQQNPESKAEKTRITGATKDSDFEDSIIIKTEKDGQIIGYAIRKNKDGNLEGNEIRYQPDGSKGPVYQLYESDFNKLRQQGVLDAYEHALTIDGAKKINDAKLAVFRIYMEGDKIDPSWGKALDANLMDPVKTAFENLSDADQEQVAADFFNETIGQDISNNKHAYHVYRHLKGTAFARKFHQLEDERLKNAGYGGFTL